MEEDWFFPAFLAVDRMYELHLKSGLKTRSLIANFASGFNFFSFLQMWRLQVAFDFIGCFFFWNYSKYLTISLAKAISTPPKGGFYPIVYLKISSVLSFILLVFANVTGCCVITDKVQLQLECNVSCFITLKKSVWRCNNHYKCHMYFYFNQQWLQHKDFSCSSRLINKSSKPKLSLVKCPGNNLPFHVGLQVKFIYRTGRAQIYTLRHWISWVFS